ncbi:unnamed protein product [Calypogeia fissa]
MLSKGRALAGGKSFPTAATAAAKAVRLSSKADFITDFMTEPHKKKGKKEDHLGSPSTNGSGGGGGSAGVADPSTAAAAGQYSILREGDADILLRGNDVFYNKAQIVNRDISIAVIRAFAAKREEEFAADAAAKKFNHKNNNNNGKTTREPHQTEESRVNESSGGAAAEVEGPSVPAGTVAVTDSSSSSPSPSTCAAAPSPSVKPIRVLEALAASGLRALRYAKEIDAVGSVVATDNDRMAFEACERNIRLNGPIAAQKVEAKHVDARLFMLTHEKEFDVVDLDPYGSPSIFLDSAVQTIADGGLLLCTATDMAVLCGNNGEVCYSKYGSYPLRGKYCHEMALRILLTCIESHANRYKRYIVPLVSLSVDFYVRVFVRIFTSAKMIKATPSKLSYVYQCVGCDSYQFQPVGRIAYKNNSARYMPGHGPTILPDCKECGKHFNMGGPMWAAPIHDPAFIQSTLSAATAMKKRYPAFDKLHSILTAVSEELVDVALYLNLHSMSATLKCTPPSATLYRSAVANAGYRISSSHANPLGVKTDAPMEVLWDIMRCWVKTHPVKAQTEVTPGTVILSKEPKFEANFSKVNSALSRAQAAGVARFLPNPEENWGPKPRAGRPIRATNEPLALAAGNVHVREEDSAADMEIDAKRQKQENGKESCEEHLEKQDE